MRVLLSAPYMLPVRERFIPLLEKHGFDVIVPEVRERLGEKELLQYIGDIDGSICGDDRFTDNVLAAAPRLRVISKWGTGIDSIDSAAAARRGVVVCRTPGAFTQAVADSVMGYMLAFARRIPWADRAVRDGGWRKIPGRALHECTLGIIGVGDIGRAVAHRAAAFGMTILGCDIRPIPQAELPRGMQMVKQDELLRSSDFVTVNCDLNPGSLHLLDRDAFRQMRRHAVLINTARGPIVDEAALVEALRSGTIAGAGLDVFEDEPLPATSPLCQLDNCLLAPHNANSSPAAWERVHRNTIENLLGVLRPDATVDWDRDCPPST